VKATSSDETARFVPLGIGKSVVIDLPRDIKDVLVSDPKIANAVARSSRKSTSRGVAIGQTKSFSSMPMISRSAGLTSRSLANLNGVRAALKRYLPGEDVYIEGVGDGVSLCGNVAVASPEPVVVFCLKFYPFAAGTRALDRRRHLRRRPHPRRLQPQLDRPPRSGFAKKKSATALDPAAAAAATQSALARA
jgi:hypothetical protein